MGETARHATLAGMTHRNGSIPFPELLRRATDGDERAWRQLHAEFDPWIEWQVGRRPTAVKVLRQFGLEPGDLSLIVWRRLVQDNFRALRDLRDRTPEGFRKYVRAMIANHVEDLRRRAGAGGRPEICPGTTEEEHDRWLEQHVDSAPTPEETVLETERWRRVKTALWDRWEHDPHRERNVLICALNMEEGKSAAWIADHLRCGITHKGVEKIITKARKGLRKLFDGPGTPARRPAASVGGPPSERHWLSDDEIVAFIDDQLDAASRQARIAHMARCAECRQRFVRRAEELDAPLTEQEMTAYHTDYRPERLAELLAAVAAERALHPTRPGRRLFDRLAGTDPARPRWLVPAGLATALVVTALAAAVLWAPREPRIAPGSEAPAALDAVLRDAGALLPETFHPWLRSGQTLRPEPPGPTRTAAGQTSSDARMELVERRLMDQIREGPPSRVADVYNALGHMKLARKKLDLAEDCYEQALLARDDDAEALIGLALVAHQRADQAPTDGSRRGLLSQAVRQLERVREPSPLRARALYNRVRILLEMNELDRAERLLGEYQQLEPGGGWASALQQAMQDARTPAADNR